MITTDNMHQGYIFRVCSVALFVVLCYSSADVVHFVCLLYFIHLLEGEGAGGGVRACCTLLLQLPSVSV